MSLSSEEIQERYRAVRSLVDAACRKVNRSPDEVTLVAVSKLHSVDAIRAAFEAGCRDFGESRVQEWRDKRPLLPDEIRWHFIGHLQRNKVKYVANAVHLLHSIDSVALVDALDHRAERPQDALLEVNVAGESSKEGVEPEELAELAQHCAASSGARPVGLMCVPPFTENPEDSRPHFQRMRELASMVRGVLGQIDEELAASFNKLSMGMTQDFEVAVEEGATILRVGTAIFGERQPGHPGKPGKAGKAGKAGKEKKR